MKNEIHNLSLVALRKEELEYMYTHCRFLPHVYWEWLSSFRFDPEKIEVYLDEEHHLHIEVTDYLYKVTLYEVPLLAIVSEIKNTNGSGIEFSILKHNLPSFRHISIAIK